MSSGARQLSPMDDFLFDLNGFLVLKGAASPEPVARLNAEFDAISREKAMSEWHRGAHRRDYTPYTGLELHNDVELGGPFEELIDYASWIELLRHFCGEEKLYVEGLFIDESVASIRRRGGHHSVHSGGLRAFLRGRFGYENGTFCCGQCNIILLSPT